MAVKAVSLPLMVFRRRLLAWYHVHKRDLPWRRTRDPYAIFVSEMMLQQTQVATVIPYYLRFLSALPRWQALARAQEDQILKLWAGLGYYRRARNLKAAARLIVKPFGGKLPRTMGAILLLPGVGEYSAGALLSIAYDRPFPLVDGNVIRVYARLLKMSGNLKTGPGNRKVWNVALRMLDQRHPGDFNQALMELGATVCTPVSPRCDRCPVAFLCLAFKTGDPERFPQASSRKRTIDVVMVAALATRGGKVLIRKRPATSRWLSGLWEFPSAEAGTFNEARRRLMEDTGIRVEGPLLREERHQITHHKIRLKLYKGHVGNKVVGRWIERSTLGNYPFSTAQSRLRSQLLIS